LHMKFFLRCNIALNCTRKFLIGFYDFFYSLFIKCNQISGWPKFSTTFLLVEQSQKLISWKKVLIIKCFFKIIALLCNNNNNNNNACIYFLSFKTL
jgi:hypothetical protein